MSGKIARTAARLQYSQRSRPGMYSWASPSPTTACVYVVAIAAAHPLVAEQRPPASPGEAITCGQLLIVRRPPITTRPGCAGGLPIAATRHSKPGPAFQLDGVLARAAGKRRE